MSKKDNKMVEPADKETVKMVDKEEAPEPKEKSKFKKGTLVCVLAVKDGGDKYASGDEYKGTDKDTTKRMLRRGAIKKV